MEVESVEPHELFRKRGEKLRTHRFDCFDMLRTAIQTGKVSSLIQLLARQIDIFQGRRYPGVHDKRMTTLEGYRKAYNIMRGKEDLPYAVGLCAEASMKFEVSPGVNSRRFTDVTRCNLPSNMEMREWGLTWEDVVKSKMTPPRLTGSAIMIYWDGVDENYAWMRMVSDGPYQGRWTVGGGFADSLSEVTALEEVLEEAALDSFLVARAQPLGVAHQFVAEQGGSGTYSFARFLNYMWEIPMGYDEHPHDTEVGRRWERVYDESVHYLWKNKLLTPIAEISLIKSGFLPLGTYYYD